MRLGNPVWVHAIWIVPAAILLMLLALNAQRRGARRFADAGLLPGLTATVSWWRRWLKGGLVATALLLVVAAMARPQWDPEEIDVRRKGRDVVFLVDVSRSMLAGDLAPNRLERTKIWIKDLVASLEGDRVGLVVFAGAPVVKCPLTLDRGFLQLALDELSPESAPKGGTLIGDAIRKTLDQVFELDEEATPDQGRFRDIVLITDGEDQDSFPVRAAERAGSQGVRIIAIGIGSEQGTPVPGSAESGDRYLTYQGQTVKSSLDADALSEIAAGSNGGVFLNVGTGTIDLAQVYADLIASAEQQTIESSTVTRYKEKYALFLAPAILLLVLESLLGERRRIR